MLLAKMSLCINFTKTSINNGYQRERESERDGERAEETEREQHQLSNNAKPTAVNSLSLVVSLHRPTSSIFIK